MIILLVYRTVEKDIIQHRVPSSDTMAPDSATKLEPQLHSLLTKDCQWQWDDVKQRYFFTGKEPTWDLEKKIAKGKKQGGLAAGSVEEFGKLAAAKQQEQIMQSLGPKLAQNIVDGRRNSMETCML